MGDDYYKKIFSKNLKHYMHINDKTQIDIINDLGINKSAISTWCNGTRLPRMDKVDMLAQYFHINRSDLIEDKQHTNVTGRLLLETTTPEEFDHIKKYRSLDQQGQETVSYILDRESKRVEELQTKSERIKELESENNSNSLHNADIRLINYYYRLASAGAGQIVFDMPPTEKIEIPDIPEYKKVDYAIGVNGNSMEPEFSNGDILLIEMTEDIDAGEIGIFIVDNESYVKKLGHKELISLNPDYKNIPLTEDSKCMGKVVDKL